MKIIKLKISLFNKSLILLIILLFSYLFYLSIPVLYNYERLQKDLTSKLLQEFNINGNLSGDITYKILPSPNFEVSNVLLNTGLNEETDDFGQIKNLKIYVSILKLYKQKNLKIKKIVLNETNFHINKKSFDFLSDYFSKKINPKKIEIKKSKIFFITKNKKDPLALYTIDNGKMFYDQKNNKNKLLINGSVYNTKSNFVFLRDFKNKGLTNFEINFRQINAKLKNDLSKLIDTNNEYKGNMLVSLLGSEIKFQYNIKDNLILLSSLKNEKNKSFFNGKIKTSPFNFNLKINLDKLNVLNFMNYVSKIKIFFQKDILLHKSFNGEINFNVDNLTNTQIFDKSNINLKFSNGKLSFNNSILISNKIGKLIVLDSQLSEIDNKKILKGEFIFEINNETNFYKKLQISKNYRKKIKNIYVEFEKDLDMDDYKINKFIINYNLKNNTNYKEINLDKVFDLNEIRDLKNWIEFKNYSKQIFSEIN